MKTGTSALFTTKTTSISAAPAQNTGGTLLPRTRTASSAMFTEPAAP